MKALPRQLALIAAVVIAVASPILQATLDWGLSAKEFADDGNGTLRAAGYAFSIWSLIYAGLIALAAFQVLPRNDGSRALRKTWPFAAIAIAGCGAWIWASAADQEWLSVAIIFVSAACAITATLLGSKAASAGLDRWLVVWPVAALAGWLTVASALNLLTVLTARDLIQGSTAQTAALAGIGAVGVVALAVLRTSRVAIYGLPVAWGLLAVFVAERGGNPDAAWVALAVGGIVLFSAGMVARPTAKRR